MIDCGADWVGRLNRVAPTAIVLTHAHSDHAFGLAKGAPCPVYATEETWALLERYPVSDRRIIRVRESVLIGGIEFEAFPVDHSLRAPAVGYRAKVGRAAFFYVPDLVAIHDRDEALRGVKLYIGDGASLTRPLVRRRGCTLIGHAAIRTQLGWCKEEGVAHAIFTHCGSEIVRSDTRAIEARLRQLGIERGVDARLAHDGLTLSFTG